MTSQSEPKWLQKCFQKPSKIDQKTKPKNNTKNHRIWLPKWSPNGAKMEGNFLPVAPREHPKPLSKYSFDFLSFLELFCLPLGSLWPPFWLPLAAFGLPFGAFWHPLASSGLPWSCLWPSQARHRQRTQVVHPFWLPLAAFGLPFGAFGLPFGQHSVTGLAAKNGQHSVTGSILSQDSSGTSCQNA